MLANKWKMFTGFIAIIVVMMVLAVPPAMAQAPNEPGTGRPGHPVARVLIVTAAAEIGITPQELLAEIQAGDGLSIADVANAHSVNPNDIVDAVVAKAAERLTRRVENGAITQAEADEKLAEIETRVTNLINKPAPANGNGQQMLRGGRILLATAAAEIGITPQELLAELRAGDGLSIADVANAHNVNPNDIVDAVVAKAAEHLTKRVENGKITQAEADEKLTELEEKVAELIEKPFPSRPNRQGQ